MRRARAAAAAALLVLTACAAERTDRVANAVAALNVPTTTATSQAPVRPAPPGQDNCTASLPPMNPLPRPGAMPAGRFMHRIQLSDEVVAASSFAPRLRRGDLVAGQYLVEGCIAHGGHGWVYLARDKHLDDSWVVLKGLLDEGDPAAAAAAIAERRFFAEVHHPNIVQIRNFVSEGGAGYIVMEYLAGKSLRELRRSEDARVMPVERAIEFVLAVLPAFEYLHSIGLLFCDFKPDNVINTVNAVRLIDLGSVHQVGGSHYTFGTVGYQAPEVEALGPSVASDAYTIARTLAVLCVDFDPKALRYGMPTAAEAPLFAEFDSLYRFLMRGTAADPEQRFASAAEMREQLALIQHEVVAKRRRRVRAPHSEWFSDEQETAAEGVDARALPSLRPRADADETDAMDAGLLAIQALIDAGQTQQAREVCRTLAADAPLEWRLDWLRGLAALLDGDHADARAAFDAVYSAVPGELAPKLALAFTAELAGDADTAAHLYDTVSRTAPAFTSASFGLARAALLHEDRDRASAAYERVPRAARSWATARVARAELLLAERDGRPPAWSEVTAAARIAQLPELDGRQAAGLRRDVLTEALRAPCPRDGPGRRRPCSAGRSPRSTSGRAWSRPTATWRAMRPRGPSAYD